MGFVLFLSLSGCGSSSSTTGSIPPTAQEVVGFSEGTGAVSSGMEFTRSVRVKNVSNAFYVAFDVLFDPTLIQYVDAQEGTFLNRSGADQTSFQAVQQDVEDGAVTIGITRLGSVDEVSGGGELMTLRFKALRAGSTPLSLGDPKGFRNKKNQEVPVRLWENTTITVQ